MGPRRLHSMVVIITERTVVPRDGNECVNLSNSTSGVVDGSTHRPHGVGVVVLRSGEIVQGGLV